MLRQHAGNLDAARQQHLALAAELTAIQKEMIQLQITQWQPILAAFDQQLEVSHQQPESDSALLGLSSFLLLACCSSLVSWSHVQTPAAAD